jgi:hypothetical protein
MKLNFITDQGSILDRTSWARRVGALAGVRAGAGLVAVVAGIRSVGLGRYEGATLAAGLVAGRAGRAGFFGLALGLVREANGAATLAAMPAIPDPGDEGT